MIQEGYIKWNDLAPARHGTKLCCAGVDRWSSYGGYFARVDVRDNDLSPRGG
jgi:hypothetical protein